MKTNLRWILLLAALSVHAAEPLKVQRAKVPPPPWPAGDERGMANQMGPATWGRCAWHLTQPGAQVYEVSQLRSNTMPLSPFAGPYVQKPKPTSGMPGTAHAFNSETYNEGVEPAQQGTQMDALGHFAALRQPWDGKPPLPAEEAVYYGGLAQKDVKPTADSPLLKLGMDKAPPIVTTAVLLDAKALVGGGKPMSAGELVTAQHIEQMLKAQGLSRRGILPGDVVYVHTGWGDYWKDPDAERFYYTRAPGLSYDAARYLGERRVVAIGLDTPFIDPVPDGMLQGKAGPAPGTPAGLPFAVHHHMLTQIGIHHVENAKLDQMARDKVWISCTIILPLREKGAAGSAIRPVAIGVPTAMAKKSGSDR
ncbi:MAG TPA: cyclase family protein [Burkholderiales bacterium]|nr:cyclase family protein [Burkholderiales bacterium]